MILLMKKMTKMNTMSENIGDALIIAIASEDAPTALLAIQQFKDNMKNVTIGAAHVMWITEPINLNTVHTALGDHLGIPRKLLAIRRALMNRTQRAVLLMQAVELSVKRVHKL